MDSENKTRVIIITQGLSPIVQPIVSKFYVVGIIEAAPRVIAKTKLKSALWKIASSSYNYFRGTYSLRRYANTNQIPYFYMKNGSDLELENWVKGLEPDIIAVYSMSQLLKKNIYSIPRLGAINLHPSYLPKYRGAAPFFWMYYNFDLEPGVTVHFIDEGEDTGDIIRQKTYRLKAGTRASEMIDYSVNCVGVPLLIQAMEDIEKGIATRTPQPRNSTTPRAVLIGTSGHDSYIKWFDWDIEHSWHFLRGTEDWLNSITQPGGIYKGQRWIIMEFAKMSMSGYNVGQVYREDKRFFVACKDGKIYLKVNFSMKNLVQSIIG